MHEKTLNYQYFGNGYSFTLNQPCTSAQGVFCSAWEQATNDCVIPFK